MFSCIYIIITKLEQAQHRAIYPWSMPYFIMKGQGKAADDQRGVGAPGLGVVL